MRRGALLLTGVAVAAVVVGANTLISRAGSDPETPVAAEHAGWRWETYRNVQLQVPDDWAQDLYAGVKFCGADWTEQKAVVRRPGDFITVEQPECPTEVRPTRHVAPSVMFAGDRPEVIRFADGWTKETRRIGEQLVTVTSADDALRAKIFSTAGVVTSVDGYGCDPASPLARDEVLRPAASGGLTSVGKVKSVSVCRYSGGAPIYREDGTPYPPKALGMEASSRLTGAVAERFVRDLIAAPLGTGPTVTTWRVCGADPGREVVVLRVNGSEHDQDVIYRYAGCKHNGTDDGTTLRRATMATAKVIFVGVHAPRGHSNVMTQLLIGPPGPVL
ncbi:hypothetical protein BWI15_27165 [Kribbella sp. ALI-6-A]|nr:hypothetical protein BWI15_27165 [Kribbella sp. ALI-6-A]